MAFSLVQIRAFVLAVQTGKLTAAARLMGLSQPTVSFHLAHLEDSLGQPLFAGGGRRFNQLTPFGRDFYRYATQMVAVEDQLVSLSDESRHLKQGVVRVGSTYSPATYFLPAVFQRFWTGYPEVDVSLEVAPSHVLLPRLLNYAQDLCLINHFPSSTPQALAEPLFEDPLVAIVAPDHPLTMSREVSVEDFSRYKVIMHEPDSISRRSIDAWFQEWRVQPDVRIEVSSTETMKEMVRNNLGIAIVSELSCRRDVARGFLVSRPIPTLKQKDARAIYLVRLTENPPPTAKAFIDVLKSMTENETSATEEHPQGENL